MEKEITVVNFENLDFNAQERLIKQAKYDNLLDSYSDEAAIFDYLKEQSREEGIMYTLSGICVGEVA